VKLTKTDYLIYSDCAKNAWVKIHKGDVYRSKPPSQFDLTIIETGNEIDILARELFPNGTTVENRDDTYLTEQLIQKHTPVIYQPVFETDKYKTACDILVWNEASAGYDLYEVKASNSGEDKKTKDGLYTCDIAFQYVVLNELGIPLNKLYLVRLNCDYVRGMEFEIEEFFIKEDFTERVHASAENTKLNMENAYTILSQEEEPFGVCKCLTRGRSAHCTTFAYSNPLVPSYSVHDITRIGLSKRKLEELVDGNTLSIFDVPTDFELSDNQRNQVTVAQSGTTMQDTVGIIEFLDEIKYPIAFLDYETFPSAMSRFIGYSPFDQIPFQFSLHILPAQDAELAHHEFLFSEASNPDVPFIKALMEYLPTEGSIIVWNKRFEMGINKKLAERNPDYEPFLTGLNLRVIDLEEAFKKQLLVHKGFKGKTSIKSVLPTLVPELSYKELDIQEGATASDTWNKITSGEYEQDESIEKIKQLKIYCCLDTKAMYAIWKNLVDIVKPYRFS
jgi:hypothetical protein